MKLLIGLGNPEVKYYKTRHNIGFMVMDEILKRNNIRLTDKFKSFFAKDGDILYCLPKTYMNLSGDAIIEIMNFFKLDVRDILVIYDDLSLNLGTLRFRADGSDGGHNGIKSIISRISSKNFDRLKVGIGPQPVGMPSERFVLDNFSQTEFEKLEKVIQIAADAALEWLREDIQKLQAKYNKQVV